MNALTNSVRKTALAARSSFISGRPRKPMSMSHARAPAGELENPGHEDDHAKRDRQKSFPAEPHQLIVAISWHEGFHHGDQEKDQANLHTDSNLVMQRNTQFAVFQCFGHRKPSGRNFRNAIS